MEIKNKFTIVSSKCVNSSWVATWLAYPKEECCQCGFKCKIRVSVEMNGHPPYTYIVTKKEFKRLQKEMKQDHPRTT
jgi:hypothetical protein